MIQSSRKSSFGTLFSLSPLSLCSQMRTLGTCRPSEHVPVKMPASNDSPDSFLLCAFSELLASITSEVDGASS